jgi:hypothetical protein
MREGKTFEESNGYVVFQMKYSRISWEKRAVVHSAQPRPFLHQASKQVYKDDMDGFFSISDIFFMPLFG